MRRIFLFALLLSFLARPNIAEGVPPVWEGKGLPVPVLAHYYIWFDNSSWNRAKIDFPLAGKYSSDDVELMREHVSWAKQAGISGFIVSWKQSEALNRRLASLVQVAAEEQFNLLLTYQALDFERQPLPVEKIITDLTYFVEQYQASSAFDLFALPVVVWTGTGQFSRDDVADVTTLFNNKLFILGSERQIAGYERISDLVSGNLYYWSSANPETDPGYGSKLGAFGKAVREKGGLWIAPSAPGFDARLVGGTRVVERDDGDVLRQSIEAASNSHPDAIGIISWNEFSENTHIEPSTSFGTRYLDIIADIQKGSPPRIEFDSSEPGERGVPYGLPALIMLGLFTLLSAGIVYRKAMRWNHDQDQADRQ